MKMLIVVDMQNDFINGSLGTKEAEAIVDNVYEKIKNFDGHVVFTRDTHYDDYLGTQEGRNLPIEHCIRGTKGWEIIDKLNTLRRKRNYPVFDKKNFGCQNLAKEIELINSKINIHSIEIVGLCTDICVISNALLIKAFYPEIPITVNSSCCAGTTKENHQKALDVMKCCQINII